ncbi:MULTISPECIES: DUF6343 family protein [Actinomadura]|uniref:DUF6343 family protein n=1 Tax=Actinomadura yumaensis TaxID=111807 RepID=A0ABW2CRV2_9ACTN|nr:DUF6343 family protein [Actinomadura sp. J1-007]MWK35242.1 hypothetical protein [Actinomadura sp. J1-007]
MPEQDHHRQPPGSEPLTARSPLRLRVILSSIALVAAVAAAAIFLVLGTSTAHWTVAAICLLIALIAVADLWTVIRRLRT